MKRTGDKLTKSKAKSFAKEEKKTAKVYKKMGLKKIGKQESSHASYFSKKSK
jgi:hypothetical protein